MKRAPVYVAVALLLVVSGCVPIHSAESMEAWVIDEATGKPVEGVVVVAHWQSEIHTMGGRIPGEQIMIKEAVTDAKGRFHFSAWGPKVSFGGIVQEKSPELLLYKLEYEYRRVINPIGGDHRDFFTYRSSWNGKAIRLKRFVGEAIEYKAHLRQLNSDLRYVEEAKVCSWKLIPSMIAVLRRQDEEFKRLGIADFYPISSWLENNEQFLIKRGCGSPAEFLKGIRR